MLPKINNWHFPRPLLAEAYLKLFEIGLTSARGLFARRRMGKTEFLKKDFIPAAEAHHYVVAYVNLWDLETDPATALVSALQLSIEEAIKPKGVRQVLTRLNPVIKKVKLSGKVAGLAEAGIEADLKDSPQITGTRLMDVMKIFDQTKIQLILVIDEAQVLAYQQNTHFAHALRAALDIRKDRIKVIFAGSSEATLRRMFGVASEPFYNWAPLEPFELLGKEFVEAMAERVNTISKFPLSVTDAMAAFTALKNTPEFFRRYIEHYISNPEQGSATALNLTKSNVFNEDSFKRQWDSLLAADQAILLMIAKGVSDLHGKAAMQQLGVELGIEGSVNKNTAQNALRRLMDKNLVTKIEHGVYQLEDEAFADWIKHSD